jgi:ABC-type Mn2+/Zn2+ transport system permease subunit
MMDALRLFLDSWPLFGTTYLTGWLCAVLLGLCGVLVVAQRQVFHGVATAQASSLGIAVALWLGPLPFLAEGGLTDHHDLHGLPLVSGILFAVAASVWTSRRFAGESPDAVGAWVFLVASSLSVLLLAHSPHGLEEVERLMFSNLIGADGHDLFKFGGMALATVAAVTWARRPILLTATDPATAAALGLPAGRIATATAAWIGLSIGLAMHSAGTLYTFGCLTLPALAARHLCATMTAMLVLAPLLGLAAAAVGFVLANAQDYPPGQYAVAAQATVLLGAWGWRRVRPR